ncbi:MAG TPA: penicillin-binding transpeptidase domain-containing protein [Planctomycetota bacterium]
MFSVVKNKAVFKTRIGLVAVALGLAFLVILGRLAQLQIVRYPQYAALAHRDRDMEHLLPALRSMIYDRNGTLMAGDQPSYDLSVRVDRLHLARVKVDEIEAMASKFRPPQDSEPEEVSAAAARRQKRDTMFEVLVAQLPSEPFVHELAQAVQREEKEITEGARKALYAVACNRASARAPFRILGGIDEKTWISLRAVHEDVFRDNRVLYGKAAGKTEPLELPPFPGLVCTISTRRVYPLGTTACFLLGIVGDLSADEEESLQQDGLLLESAGARARAWARMREEMNDQEAARLEPILRVNPRDIYDMGELYRVLSRLRPSDRQAAAELGLAEPVRWTERPPRMQLNIAEKMWLGVGLPTNTTRNRLPNKTIGEQGIERFYNDRLRGKHGMKIREGLDKEVQSSLAYRDVSTPEEGEPLALTISLPWQKAVESALKSQSQPGAVVVLDVKTGEVLAMASWPDFDPNLFTPPREGPHRQEQLRALLCDPAKPLLNRAISEQYPLGSVMKCLIAAAALEKGVVTTSDTFECPGYIIEGGQKFHCDDARAHGTVQLIKGLRVSCNVTFQQIGARLGVEGLAPFAKLIFGHKTGLDLPGETSGIYPDRAWRLRAYPNNPSARIWTRGNDYLLSIGQGHFACSVLQATVLMAAICNGGQVVTPRLWLDAPKEAPKSLGISPQNLAIVRQGMEEVVNVNRPGERGTAYTAFHEHGPELAIKVAGKTSTAEHKKGAEAHAWFAGYAPADNPQVAFAVFIQEGGHGGKEAAPVAYKFLKEIYGTRNAPVKNPGAPQEVAASEPRP